MKTEDVLKLIDAGYTKAEIAAMDRVPVPDILLQREDIFKPAPEPAPEPTPAPDPGPEPTPQPDAMGQFAGMLQTMFTQFGDRMQSIMQKMNLQTTEQPVPESAQDVIASIINPPGRDKK